MTKSETDKKEKARWARVKRVYGITKEQYDILNLGYCNVCLHSWSDSVRPCIDHDHVTGEVRGLLCIHCNRYVVGRHRDPDLVRRAADYLALPRRGWIVPKKKRKKRARTKSKRK